MIYQGYKNVGTVEGDGDINNVLNKGDGTMLLTEIKPIITKRQHDEQVKIAIDIMNSDFFMDLHLAQLEENNTVVEDLENYNELTFLS